MTHPGETKAREIFSPACEGEVTRPGETKKVLLEHIIIAGKYERGAAEFFGGYRSRLHVRTNSLHTTSNGERREPKIYCPERKRAEANLYTREGRVRSLKNSFYLDRHPTTYIRQGN